MGYRFIIEIDQYVVIQHLHNSTLLLWGMCCVCFNRAKCHVGLQIARYKWTDAYTHKEHAHLHLESALVGKLGKISSSTEKKIVPFVNREPLQLICDLNHCTLPFNFGLNGYPIAPRCVSTFWWSWNGVFRIIISFFYCSIWNYLSMMLTNLISICALHIPFARIGFTFCLAKPSDSWHRTRCVCLFGYGYASVLVSVNTVNCNDDDSAESAQHCSLLFCAIHSLAQTLYLFLCVYPWFARIISHSKMLCTQLVHHTVYRSKIFRRTVYTDDG